MSIYLDFVQYFFYFFFKYSLILYTCALIMYVCKMPVPRATNHVAVISSWVIIIRITRSAVCACKLRFFFVFFNMKIFIIMPYCHSAIRRRATFISNIIKYCMCLWTAYLTQNNNNKVSTMNSKSTWRSQWVMKPACRATFYKLHHSIRSNIKSENTWKSMEI